jgi:PAS domain S-box-containing protein
MESPPTVREGSDWLGCFNQRLLDTLPDAVYLYDLVDQRNVFLTRSIENLLGYTEENLVMQDIGLANLIHPNDLAAVAEYFQRFATLPAGKVVEIRYRMKRVDGQWIWLRSRETPFIQAIDGYPLQILGIVQIIPEDAQFERFWKSVSTEQDQTEEMVMITDLDGVIQQANQKFEQVTGYTRAEVLGKTPSILKSGQHQPAFYQHLWDTVRSGQVFRGAFVNRKKSGELFHEDQTIVPLRDGKGNITHFLAVGQDVTGCWQV